MLPGILIYWLQGMWGRGSGPSSMLADVNNNTIAVGNTVKLVGVITALNPNETHFDQVSIRLTHPGGTGRDPISREVLTVHPTQLVLGN